MTATPTGLYDCIMCADPISAAEPAPGSPQSLGCARDQGVTQQQQEASLSLRSYTSVRARKERNSLRARDAWKRFSVADQTAAGELGTYHHRVNRDGYPLEAAGSFCSKRDPPRPMPLAGFERLVADVGLRESRLDILLAVATGQLEEASPETESYLSQSYFSCIPSRYGQTACLDDAVRCLGTQLRRVLTNSQSSQDPEYLALYGKALHSVQLAICGEGWAEPEALCAVLILSLCEVYRALPEYRIMAMFLISLHRY
jgi:hypothetical protein